MSRIIPIVLLIVLGFVLRRISFLSAEAKSGLDKIVVRISLPVLLFLSFAELELGMKDLPIVGIVFLYCILLFVVGKAAFFIAGSKERLVPYLNTGLSFGLIGVPLFQMVYGLENMGVFARLGIGHEFFFWMFFLTFLDRDFGGRKKFRSTLLSLAKSPGVIAIVAGIALSLFRVGPHVEGSEILRGIRGALQALASLASPLVLLSVGYGIRFQKGQLKKAFAFTGLRIASTLSLGFLLKTQLVDRLYPRTPLMDHGFFLLFVLPPIFSLSLFISPHSNSDEIALANNVIVLYTLYTLTSFIAYALAFPPV